MAQQPADRRTASQRIEDLERAVMSIFQVSNNMARENTMMKDAIKLLSNRVTALIQALVQEVSSKVGEDAVDAIMKLNQIEELKEKVANLIQQGFLVATEAVSDNTFLVGSEAEPDQTAEDGTVTAGKVVHPRLQFTLASLAEEVKAKLLGARPGDVVNFKEGALLFKLAEVYKIENPTPVEAPAPEATAPAEVAAEAAPAEAPVVTEVAPVEAAPVAEQSSTDAATAAPAAPADSQAAGN